MENAVITPHVAGVDYLPETAGYIMQINLENASRFMQGKPLKSLIDFKTGYRIPED
jgi:phosphoglycerate dehydrogenase-like enzyme